MQTINLGRQAVSPEKWQKGGVQKQAQVQQVDRVSKWNVQMATVNKRTDK